MPLWTEREETISVTSSKLFENVFAFPDIKTLKLQAINYLITQSI